MTVALFPQSKSYQMQQTLPFIKLGPSTYMAFYLWFAIDAMTIISYANITLHKVTLQPL